MENFEKIKLKLIPEPKEIVTQNGFLTKRSVKKISVDNVDIRICKLIDKLPVSENGVDFKLEIESYDGDGYNLKITEKEIAIKADGVKGAFYGIQTLRQIFENDYIPFCEINDKPDFEFRGAYLDITRGKVPKIETIKAFIDKIAYFKMNSLQLYVEHTYEFREYAESIERTGYITSEELKELDLYCRDNFIDFIPSLSTFGHLYELLQSDRYKHLRVIDNYKPERYEWCEKAKHHTIDPLNPESIEVIKSLIDQYSINFTSEWFNICCDETFDLQKGKYKDRDVGELYTNFVQQIIEHVKKKGKKIMMWGDILYNHPEHLNKLSEDIMLLNWYYRENPDREIVKRFYDKDREQILCVGTWTWINFCENISKSLPNIENMTRLGYEYNAKGILTTIWGDHGHTCSLELADCGLAFGADRSWNVEAKREDIFAKLDKLVYKAEGLSMYLQELCDLQNELPLVGLILLHEYKFLGVEHKFTYFTKELVESLIKKLEDFCRRLENEKYDNEHKKEMLLAAEALRVMCEIGEANNGAKLNRHTDTEKWLKKYREAWLSKNKESELRDIEKIFMDLEMTARKVIAMKEYINSFFDEYDFPQEARDELICVYDKIQTNGIWNLLSKYIDEYNEKDTLQWDAAADEFTKMSKEQGVHEYSVNMIFLICLTKHAKELYEKKGLSCEVYKETFNDLKCKLFECHNVYGIWGNAALKTWYGRFFELNLFAFGRFQFEKSKFWDAKEYVVDGRCIKKDDLIINIHIPSSGKPVTKDAIDDSFAKAYEFYKDLFEDKVVLFTLRSWLLNPEHREFLPQNSNILNLLDYFKIISYTSPHWGDWWRIFNKEYNDNLDEMPSDTSLQRAYIDWVKKGNSPCYGRGVLFYKPE